MFSVKEAKKEVWVEGDAVYCGFNLQPSSVKPKIPAKPNGTCITRMSRADRLQNMQWETAKFPYLAYLLRRQRFSSTILQPLAIHPLQIPLRTIGLQAKVLLAIGQSFQESWYKLEYMLFEVCRYLEVACSRRSDMGHCVRPWKPSLYFSKKADVVDERKLRSHIWAGRDQFFLVLAYISYLVAHLDKEEEHKIGTITVTYPSWHHQLRNFHVHPDIIDLLTEAGVADWNQERIGCVVDLKTCHYPDKLQMILTRNIPFVYYWPRYSDTYIVHQPLPPQYICRFAVANDKDEEVLKRWLRSFAVPPEIIREAADLHEARTKSMLGNAEPDVSDNIDGAELEGSTPIGSDYPILDWRSGQDLYESRETFMRRRAKERSLLLCRESLRMRQLRLEREEIARLAKAPKPDGSTSVFTWAKEGDGQWEVRRKMDPSLISSIWYAYTTHEKFYDSLKDEWDLWKYESQSDILPQDDLVLEDVDDSLEVREEVEATLVAEGRDQFLKDMNMVGNWDALVGFADMEISSMDTFLEVATIQLGYIQSSPLAESYAVHPGFKWEDNKCRRVLLQGDAKIHDLDLTRIKHLAQYLLLRNSSQVPRSLWDLKGVHVSHFGNRKIHIASGFLSKEIPESNNEAQPTFEVIHETGLKDLRLFVARANTALEIRRVVDEEQIAKQEDIPIYLLDRGIPFVLARNCSEMEVRSYMVPPRDITPQTRMQGYIPDKTDYDRYVKKRQEFLRSDRGGKVLRMGGILWRLALESLDQDVGARGPGKSESVHPISRSDGRPEAFDDGLTLEELGLVYGLYHTYPGKE